MESVLNAIVVLFAIALLAVFYLGISGLLHKAEPDRPGWTPLWDDAENRERYRRYQLADLKTYAQFLNWALQDRDPLEFKTALAGLKLKATGADKDLQDRLLLHLVFQKPEDEPPWSPTVGEDELYAEPWHARQASQGARQPREETRADKGEDTHVDRTAGSIDDVKRGLRNFLDDFLWRPRRS